MTVIHSEMADSLDAPACVLRPATRADEPAIRQVVFATLAEYGLSPSPATTDADLFDLERAYFLAGGAFSVLVAPSGEIIGTYGLAKISPDTFELRKMYLLAAWRGRGLGRRMLDAAILDATRLGARRLTLETASVLKEAVALYRRRGFVNCHSAHLSCRCDLAMVLELKNPSINQS
jgi:putative acetyltransferase